MSCVATSCSGRELSGQENLVWNTDLIETMEFENVIGQAAQSPYSDKTRNESRGAREPRVKWMKHVLTIGSQTRGRSTSCVGVPRGDQSTVGRSDEPCVISETCVLNVAGRRRCSARVAVTAVSAREEQTCSQSQKRVQAEI